MKNNIELGQQSNTYIMIIRRFHYIIFLLSGVAEAYAQGPDARQVKYLSGIDNENTVAWDFQVTGGRKSGNWTQIQVPSHWEQEGFGTYNYGRDYVTYGKNFRFPIAPLPATVFERHQDENSF